MPDAFATTEQVAAAWRPLSPAETEKAQHWLDRTSRRIRVLWPDVDDRIAAGVITEQDVADEVIDIVVTVLDAPKGSRHYKTFNRSSGAESIGYSLRDDVPGGTGWVVLTQGLLELLGVPLTATGAPLPVGVFPPAPRFDLVDRPRRIGRDGRPVVWP